jgi:hypothetical protein
MLYHRFQTFFPSVVSQGGGYRLVSRLLGSLVLGDLVALARV